MLSTHRVDGDAWYQVPNDTDGICIDDADGRQRSDETSMVGFDDRWEFHAADGTGRKSVDERRRDV